MSRSRIDDRVATIGGRRKKRYGQQGDASADRQASRRGKPRYSFAGRSRDAYVMTAYFDPSLGQPPALVCDVSASGVALQAREQRLRIGDSYRVRVSADGANYALLIKVMNRRGEILGCKVLDADNEWKHRIAELLDPVTVGKGVREVDAGAEGAPETPWHRDTTPGLELRRFYAPGLDLFAWRRADGATVRVLVFYLGTMVDWSLALGVRTGQRRLSGVGKGFAATFAPDVDVDLEKLETVQRILKSAAIDAALVEPVLAAR